MKLQVQGVSFSYRSIVVLDDVDFELECGITGLLGPNGAGKSTLLNILATVLRPAQGQAIIDGCPTSSVEAARRLIGFLPQRFDLMRQTSVIRNVAYAAWCNGVDRHRCETAALDALGVVDLVDRARDPVARLSGGQRQRVGIACAIAHKPRVVLLDEPTVGLDPTQRVQIRRYLRQVASDATVLMSTHIVEDLTQLASSVIVLNRGRICMHGSIDELAHLGRDSAFVESGVSEVEAGYMALLDSHSASRGNAN